MLIVQQYSSIVVEPDDAAIGTLDGFIWADDDGALDVSSADVGGKMGYTRLAAQAILS